MVRSTISEWHQIEEDLVKLLFRLVDLGMECHGGTVYLADIEENDESDTHNTNRRERTVLHIKVGVTSVN